jgi:hypothetical protein
MVGTVPEGLEENEILPVRRLIWLKSRAVPDGESVDF